MNLIEQYLRAVELLLPREKRDDIVKELRELILSKIEARESELGRKLTDDEVEAVLREIGHPVVVASRYRDGPQHVVGPTLYPYWLFAVKAAIAIQIVIAGMVFLVRALTGDVARAFGQAVGSAVTGTLVLIGVATIAAWLLERGIIRLDYFERWRVRDLGFLGFAAWDGEGWRDWFETHRAAAPSPATAAAAAAAPAAPYAEKPNHYADRAERRRQSRERRYAWRRRSVISRGLAGVAVAAVLLLWWIGVIRFGIASGPEDFRAIGIEPGPIATFDWAALKTALYVPVLAYVALIVVQGVTRIVHPTGVRIQGLLDLTVAALLLGTVAWLWSYSPLSSAVAVDTVAAFVRRMRELVETRPPFPLAPILTLALALTAFGAVIRAISGIFELVLPSPRLWEI